jgi:hypothetical protein
MRGNFHFYFVARTEPDKIRYRGPGRVGRDFPLILQNQPVSGVRKQLDDSSYGRVSTHGPFAVIATQCSKCAE